MSFERCFPLMCVLVCYVSCISSIASAIDVVPVTANGGVLLICRIVDRSYRRKVRSVVICNRASEICILGLVILRMTGPLAIIGRMSWWDEVMSVRI